MKKTLYLVLAWVFVLGGCGGDDYYDDPPVDSVVASTPTDIYKTIAVGPSLSFNNLTGGVNDLAINPVTHLPAVIYYDKSSTAAGTVAVGALKYAYQDETGVWRIELVDANYGTAACGTINSYCLGAPNAAAGSTASIMKLAFKSDGTPAIAYVFGASVATVSGTKQIRYAERGSSGWSIATAFSSSTAAGASNASTTATVDPMKAVTLAFDSSNRPHVTFALYAQTILSSEIRYLFRSTSGSWTSTSIGPAVSGAGTITALGQGTAQAGAAFCAASGRPLWTHQLVNGAAGVGQPLYISCSTVDANGACATFSTLNLAAGCTGASTCFTSAVTTATNGGARTDLAIDAATQRPIIGMYTVTTPATSLLTAVAPLSCGQIQSSGTGDWGTPISVGGASQGLHGFRLASSSTTQNQNFIAYLTSTTSVTVNKSTGIPLGWLATGTNVETTTVAAEGLGAAYDATNDLMAISYASIPAGAAAAAGNDVKVAFGSEGDITNAGAAGIFNLENIDNTGNAFPTTAVPMLSAAKSSTGQIGFAYFYQDGTPADSKLYYGVRAGSGSNAVFGMNTVVNHIEGAASPQFVGSYPSLAYDSGNNPVIAYYNGVAAQQNLNVARSADGGSSFTTLVVDDTSANVGQYPSLATSGSSLGMAYYDVTNTGLKFARYTATQGWKRFSVDGVTGTGSCGNSGDDAGSFATLRFTSTGRPVVAYQSQGALKVAYASDALTSGTYTWSCLNLDASANTRGAGIAFELGTDDSIHLLHFDATAGTIRYVRCASAASTCFATGASAFTSSLVEGVGTTAAISTKPTLKVTDAAVYAAFYSASYQSLRLAKRSSDTWSIESLDSPSAGTFVSQVGQYADMVINSSGLPTLFYRSNENWLRYFSRELP